MKFKVRYLPTAVLDLLEIDEQLHQHPAKASKLFSKLDKQLSTLSDMPFMYPVYDDYPVYRKMVVYEYLVFYIVDKERNYIDIHRIIYGKMDMRKQFISDT